MLKNNGASEFDDIISYCMIIIRGNKKMNKNKIEISIIIPAYNEEENIPLLYAQLKESLLRLNKICEIIFVDDGSVDKTFFVLSEIAKTDEQVKVIQFTRNFGQTAAVQAGIDEAQGSIIVLMDSDLQNDSSDIIRLINKLNEGYDIVSGWRKKRKDSLFTRKIPSWIANRLISLITGTHLHDYGCTLKAYQSVFIKDVKLYGEMHRFIPAYASWQGAKIGEIIVNHRARKYGVSKYKLARTFKVILDLITIKFLGSYLSKPIYIFGGIGMLLTVLGIGVGIITLIQKYFYGIWVHKNPLLLLAVFLFIIGTQFIMLGLLAEIIIRTYYAAKERKPYFIKEKINFKKKD